MSKIVHFFGDPMCSWCWGFTKELHSLVQQASGKAELRICAGGLRPFTKEVMDDAMRTYIRHHWEEVDKKTGQPFDYALFERTDFVYDTEPSCRAVVTARRLKPETAFAMFESLQRAFYAEGRDVTQDDVLADVAVENGLDRQMFLSALNGDEAKKETIGDFNRAREHGVQAFPTVVCEEDGQFALLTGDWRPYAEMEPLFKEWLTTR